MLIKEKGEQMMIVLDEMFRDRQQYPIYSKGEYKSIQSHIAPHSHVYSIANTLHSLKHHFVTLYEMP